MMFVETGLLSPYMHNLAQDFQLLEEDYYNYQKTHDSLSNLIETSTILQYDLGGGDLFKAPQPIMEEPVVGLDPVTAAILMMLCGEEAIAMHGLKAVDIESIQKEQLLSEVFYECRKDLVEKAAIEMPLLEVLDMKIPPFTTMESSIPENQLIPDIGLAKSASTGCLNSMEWIPGAAAMENIFPDIPAMDYGTVFGLRRAYSEGDIKTLAIGNGDKSFVHSPIDQPLTIRSCTAEERKEKLSRYRNKKSKRNFGRKIKYACRKALADNQPRIRGRFAKTESSNFSTTQ